MLPPIDILTPEVLDELGESLVSRIIGPVESNTNGSYVRLENGWQVCWNSADATGLVPSSSTAQVDVWSVNVPWTFPAPFIAPPAVTPPNPRLRQGGSSRSGHLPSGYSAAITNVGCVLSLQCLATFDNAERPYPIAVGRWK